MSPRTPPDFESRALRVAALIAALAVAAAAVILGCGALPSGEMPGWLEIRLSSLHEPASATNPQARIAGVSPRETLWLAGADFSLLQAAANLDGPMAIT